MSGLDSESDGLEGFSSGYDRVFTMTFNENIYSRAGFCVIFLPDVRNACSIQVSSHNRLHSVLLTSGSLEPRIRKSHVISKHGQIVFCTTQTHLRCNDTYYNSVKVRIICFLVFSNADNGNVELKSTIRKKNWEEQLEEL